MLTEHEVITAKELCAWLRISKGTALKLLNDGEIPARRTGKVWRIHRKEVELWLRKREREGDEAQRQEEEKRKQAQSYIRRFGTREGGKRE